MSPTVANRIMSLVITKTVFNGAKFECDWKVYVMIIFLVDFDTRYGWINEIKGYHNNMDGKRNYKNTVYYYVEVHFAKN